MVIKLLTYLTVYSLFACTVRSQEQITECKCRMDDGSIIDLTSLGNKDGTPLFRDIQSPDGFLYSYSACGGFSEGVCSNAAICQKDEETGATKMIGEAKGAEFSADIDTKAVVLFYYVHEQGTIKTLSAAYLLCPDESYKGPSQFFPNGTYDTEQYIMTLYSVCACPGRCDANGVISNSTSTVGAGSILLIIASLSIVLYFIIGSVFMKFGRKASGTDIIPNKEFWVGLPGNVKNGTLFIINRCTGKKGEYSDIK